VTDAPELGGEPQTIQEVSSSSELSKTDENNGEDDGANATPITDIQQ
jgi:lipoteichoic acid synthase